MRVLLPALIVIALLWIIPITIELRVHWLRTRYFLYLRMNIGWRRFGIRIFRYVLRSKVATRLPDKPLFFLLRHLARRVLPRAVYDWLVDLILVQAVRLSQRTKVKTRAVQSGILPRLAGRVRLSRMDVIIAYGSHDAADTAVGVGLAWAAAGAILGVGPAVGLDPGLVRVRVIPLFNKSVFRGRLHCIFTARAADIISAYAYGWRRGGECRERTSNSRSDENSNGQH